MARSGGDGTLEVMQVITEQSGQPHWKGKAHQLCLILRLELHAGCCQQVEQAELSDGSKHVQQVFQIHHGLLASVFEVAQV